MKNLNFIAGIAFIAFWVGNGVASVGQKPESDEPFPPTLPFSLLVITAVPFVLGYRAGKASQ